MAQKNTLTIKILDKEYMFACKEDEEDGLRQAAAYLDKSMKKIRSTGKVHGPDRIAVMAALNITHELLQTGNAKSNSNQMALKLAGKIDDLLQEIS